MSALCWCGGLAAGAVCLDSEYHDPTATGLRDRVTKLYIAGPMSGHPECNYPAFHEAAETLRSAGYTVVNPAECGVPNGTRVHYVDLIREDLRLLLDCHGIAALDGWWNSAGARNEVNVAELLKMPVRQVPEWLYRVPKELGS